LLLATETPFRDGATQEPGTPAVPHAVGILLGRRQGVKRVARLGVERFDKWSGVRYDAGSGAEEA